MAFPQRHEMDGTNSNTAVLDHPAMMHGSDSIGHMPPGSGIMDDMATSKDLDAITDATKPRTRILAEGEDDQAESDDPPGGDQPKDEDRDDAEQQESDEAGEVGG